MAASSALKNSWARHHPTRTTAMLGANATTRMPREPPTRPMTIHGRRMPSRDEVRSLILPKNGLPNMASRAPIPATSARLSGARLIPTSELTFNADMLDIVCITGRRAWGGEHDWGRRGRATVRRGYETGTRDVLLLGGAAGPPARRGPPPAGPGAAGTCVSLGGKVRGAVPAAPWPGPAGTAIWVARCESAGTGLVPPVLALWSG